MCFWQPIRKIVPVWDYLLEWQTLEFFNPEKVYVFDEYCVSEFIESELKIYYRVEFCYWLFELRDLTCNPRSSNTMKLLVNLDLFQFRL